MSGLTLTAPVLEAIQNEFVPVATVVATGEAVALMPIVTPLLVAGGAVLGSAIAGLAIGTGINSLVDYYADDINKIFVPSKSDEETLVTGNYWMPASQVQAPIELPLKTFPRPSHDLSNYETALGYIGSKLDIPSQSPVVASALNTINDLSDGLLDRVATAVQNFAIYKGQTDAPKPDLSSLKTGLGNHIKKTAQLQLNKPLPPPVIEKEKIELQKKGNAISTDTNDKLKTIADNIADGNINTGTTDPVTPTCACEMLIVEAINGLTAVMTPALISWGSVATLLSTFLTGHALTRDELAEFILVPDPDNSEQKINLLKVIADKEFDSVRVGGESL